jgi:catechol 2,3-dioxygenase-like lactoylglutathione lyase family enzyme
MNGGLSMALNHLNLPVPDVAKTRAFFETYFGFRCIFERGRDTIAVLTDESRFIFTLSNFDRAAAVEYPGAFHVGFEQPSRERVDEFYERLKNDGHAAEPPRDFHGAWTFYLHAPGGFLVEVFHQHRRGPG